MKNRLFLFFCFLAFLISFTPDSARAGDAAAPADSLLRRIGFATRTTAPVKIDGVLDEPEWQTAHPFNDFIQLELNPGKPSQQKTDVRVLYDDKFMYIGATLFDPHPDSILKELTQRDNIGNDDYFAVFFDTYKDGVNGFGFFVTAADVQGDAKYYPPQGDDNGNGNGGEDFNWSAVWRSKARITDKGWVIEMAIPYSAIRFPKVKDQHWRINFMRSIRRSREKSFWNLVDKNINGFVNQWGDLEGVQNIQSPVRLQATPFIATYLTDYHDKTAAPVNQWGKSITGGMDVKYGINDAFTLDMTLIPDFGQVPSDPKVLNLTPFEVKYDEYRPFFTEGVELFNKGSFFYSRRVGQPLHYYDVANNLNTGDTIMSNPSTAQLYNATKISGRTSGGLGIGLFNATAGQTYAVIRDAEGKDRTYLTNPLTNYNVLVLDQNLKNNSYISLINTTVWREGNADYNANVTGTAWDFKDKKNLYTFNGNAGLSQLYYPGSTSLGLKYQMNFAKASGKYQYQVWNWLIGRDYQQSDLGYERAPNSVDYGFWNGYFMNEPHGAFNQVRVNGYFDYSTLQQPNVYSGFETGFNTFFLTKKLIAFGLSMNASPFAQHDYYEPRTSDYSRFFLRPASVAFGPFLSTDYGKPFAFDLQFFNRIHDAPGRDGLDAEFTPRYRLNDHVSLKWDLQYNPRFNYVRYSTVDAASMGYTPALDNEILFGKYDQSTVVNAPSLDWKFNSSAFLTFRLRHYWSKVRYKEFYTLNPDGTLSAPLAYRGESPQGARLNDINYNLFNLDLVFDWRFSPGSDFIITYKNVIQGTEGDTQKDYFFNAGRLTDNPQLHTLSLKVVYFLDYLSFKKRG